MKRFVALLLALTLVCCCAGCSSKKTKAKKDDNSRYVGSYDDSENVEKTIKFTFTDGTETDLYYQCTKKSYYAYPDDYISDFYSDGVGNTYEYVRTDDGNVLHSYIAPADMYYGDGTVTLEEEAVKTAALQAIGRFVKNDGYQATKYDASSASGGIYLIKFDKPLFPSITEFYESPECITAQFSQMGEIINVSFPYKKYTDEQISAANEKLAGKQTVVDNTVLTEINTAIEGKGFLNEEETIDGSFRFDNNLNLIKYVSYSYEMDDDGMQSAFMYLDGISGKVLFDSISDKTNYTTDSK